jgi:hypothetical protein
VHVQVYSSVLGGAGITNQGLNTRVNGAIGTTAASSLVTGFTDTMASPLKYTPSYVVVFVLAATPAPGNATKAKKH